MKGAGAAAPWRLARTLEPTLHAVDGVCAEVRRRLKPRVSAGDWYSVELLLREALTNAVLHGGGEDLLRRVRCEVRVGARGVRMSVADGGPGFDWRAALAAEPAGAATSGRGLKIYALYADRVSFNQRGNRVVLERRFERRNGGRKTSGREAR